MEWRCGTSVVVRERSVKRLDFLDDCLLGWGSLTLYLAQVRVINCLVPLTNREGTQKYPNSRIIGLSNSRTQKEYIDTSARSRGLQNVEVDATADYMLVLLVIPTIL